MLELRVPGICPVTGTSGNTRGLLPLLCHAFLSHRAPHVSGCPLKKTTRYELLMIFTG